MKRDELPQGAPVVRDPSNPVVLGGPAPFVDPRITDPAALAYASRAEKRRAPLPRYDAPVAGGSDLPIPHLGAEAVGGQTMANQALAQRGALPVPSLTEMVQGMGAEPAMNRGIVVGQPQAAQQMPRPTPARTSIVTSDLLPEAAKDDPAFRPGHGSMFAANQPHLATKYGVIRGGEHIPPQMLDGGAANTVARTGKLRDETAAGVAEVLRHNAGAPPAPASTAPAAPEADPEEVPAGKQKDLQELLDRLDDFDLSRLKSALFKDTLNNDKQRAIIEARLAPLDLSQLISTGRITQTVVVQPNVLEFTFQSYSGYEDLEIKRLIGQEAQVSDRYVMDKYQLMGLTIALAAINRRPLPGYTDNDGNFDAEAFWRKYHAVSRMNFHMLASAQINWFWFDVRVRKLLQADELGNG